MLTFTRLQQITPRQLELLGQYNDRQILYSNFWTDENSFEKLPTGNWLVVPIGQDKEIDLYSQLADKCIDMNVLYVCALGQSCELIHDIFDEPVVAKKIAAGDSIESPIDFEDSPMTTWHYNFSEGFWFALTSAYDSDKIIDKVVCIDFTSKGVKKYLGDLINKMENGWLPSDEKIQEPKYDN